MKKQLLLTIICTISVTLICAQTKFGAYEAKFGSTSTLKGKEGIKTTQIIAETKKNLYMILSGDRSNYRDEKKVMLQSVDKKSLRPEKTIELDENINDQGTYKFQSIFENSEGFMTVSEVLESGFKKVFVSYIDHDLHVNGFSQKLLEYDYVNEDVRIVQRPNSTDFVVLRQEKAKPDEQIIVKYDLYDEKLKVKHTGEVDMGITFKKKRGLFADNSKKSLLDKFNYTESGDLVYMSWIIKESESGKRGDYNLIFLNPLNDQVEQKGLFASEDVYIGEYTILEMEGDIILSGLYSDDKKFVWSIWNNERQPSASDFNGTFFIRYDHKTHNQVINIKTPFDQSMMNQLTRTNPAVNRGLFGKKRASKDQDDVSGNYEINKVIYSTEEKTATFYCEYVYNTVTTTSNSTANGTTTTTTYTSTRGNFFFFELSLVDGSMNYFNTVRKYASYSSGNSSVWYKETMFVVPRPEGELVFYNSQRIFNEKDASDVKGIKIKTKKLEQDYLVTEINGKTGKYQTETPSLVPSKLKPYDKLQMERCFVSDMERACYTINSHYKYRIGLAVLSCATLPICCTGYFIYALTRKKAYDEVYTIARVTF